jgi:hypothetical protein
MTVILFNPTIFDSRALEQLDKTKALLVPTRGVETIEIHQVPE